MRSRNFECVLWRLCFALVLAWGVPAHSGERLAIPEIDELNPRVGTQTFSPRYHFTTNSALVETAQAIREMGSESIKLYLGNGMSGQYGIQLSGNITSLARLVTEEPSVRQVLDMPFRHIIAWAYCFSGTDTWFKDGYSDSERQKEYEEMFALTAMLLTNYSGSGKTFYLGHWEGDWYLLNNYVTTNNPSTTAITGMIDWLNNRQKAVDDAVAAIPHTNVWVYNYAEINRVRDAMINGPESNIRLVNAVLPAVTNLDFVSWSSYDGMNLGQADLIATLDYIESHLSTNKAARIPGRRVFIGEYGWGGSLPSAGQEPVTRAYVQKLLPWNPRFILFWQIYNNEPGRSYWLIDSNNVRTPCFDFHQRLINHTRMTAARFYEKQGRVPSESELAGLLVPALNNPLPDPVPLAITNRPLLALGTNAAAAAGVLQQNVYGDELARVGVCWGRVDGGSNRLSWEHWAIVGTNRQFNPSLFSLELKSLVPGTNYWFRFFATNAAGETFAPTSSQFRTEVLNPPDFGSKLRIRFDRYNRAEPLIGFPALVVLSSNIPGFSYSQFAALNGSDLCFTDATGTQPIPHEIEEWNTNGASLVWVRVPLLEAFTTEIWAYWGNPFQGRAASQTNGAVWIPGAELVWHLKETGFPYSDSARKHPALSGDAPTHVPSGQIGQAALFNGTSDCLNAGVVNLGDRFTFSAWIRLDSTASSIQTIWANKAGGSASSGVALFVNSYNSKDQKLILETGNGTDAAYASTDNLSVPAGRWCHVAAAVNRPAGVARMYIDGVERSIPTNVRPDHATNGVLYAGRFVPDSTYFFHGLVDEMRVDSECRSGDWIWASWMNTASNGSFLTFSSVISANPPLTCLLNAGSLGFTWPAYGLGFRLVSCSNLTNPDWQPLTNRPVFVRQRWAVQISTKGSQTRFFLLQQVP
jgi:hypothetical protein